MNPRHRLWLRQANGPLPDPLPRFIKGGCPDYPEIELSCSSYPTAIYLNRWDWKHRPTFLHEVVHWFDSQYFTDRDREEIRVRYHWPNVRWTWDGWSPLRSHQEPNCERLAKVGVDMFLHPARFKWLRQKFREAKGREVRVAA